MSIILDIKKNKHFPKSIFFKANITKELRQHKNSDHVNLQDSNVSSSQSYLWSKNRRFNEQINWVGIRLRPTSMSDAVLTFGEIT